MYNEIVRRRIMLSVKNLSLKYSKEFSALNNISFDIEDGESVALIGQDESGKTSLLRVLAKVEEPTSGAVYINDRNLKKINYRTDLSAGYIPATPAFFENKTVYENLKYVLSERKIPPVEMEAMINQKVIDFNLEKIKDQKVGSLSVEEKYILSFIRLSFRELDLLMIDNIFDYLSEFYIDMIVDLVKGLKSKKTTLIVATTSEDIADLFAKRKIYFSEGQIVNN